MFVEGYNTMNYETCHKSQRVAKYEMVSFILFVGEQSLKISNQSPSEPLQRCSGTGEKRRLSH